ncbi:MAG: DUF2341 domain-containing protein, partial [Verrucomicrobiota bacterium]
MSRFLHRARIEVCGWDRSETLTNFPTLLVLSTNIAGFAYHQFADPEGGDLRFVNSDQTIELNYEIEHWDPAGNSYVWVQIPALVDSSTSIYAYWGNTSSTNPPFHRGSGATWSEGYVGVWHLGDDAGSRVFPDASGNGNHARDEPVEQSAGFSDTTTTDGPIGQAQTFGGPPDELVVDNPHNFSQTNGLSISVWFRVRNFTTLFQTLVAKGSMEEWRLNRLGSQPFMQFEAGGHGSLNTTIDVDDGEWHHILATQEAPHGKRIYIDGHLAAARLDHRPIIPNPEHPVRIGENPANGSQYRNWNGDIDEVRISSVRRSADWAWASWYNVVSNENFLCYELTSFTNRTDLALIKTVSPANLAGGSNLSYTIDIMNTSTMAAFGVIVTDAVPFNVRVDASEPPADQTNGLDYIYHLGSMTPGGSTSIVIDVTVTSFAAPAVINRAWVVSTNLELDLVNNLGLAVVHLLDTDGDGLTDVLDPDD